MVQRACTWLVAWRPLPTPSCQPHILPAPEHGGGTRCLTNFREGQPSNNSATALSTDPSGGGWGHPREAAESPPYCTLTPTG